MKKNVLNFYFDGKSLFKYTEPDAGTALTLVELFANWETTDSYDSITISSK